MSNKDDYFHKSEGLKSEFKTNDHYLYIIKTDLYFKYKQNCIELDFI